MKNPDLYKFFSRDFLEEDVVDLKNWLEENSDHQNYFLQERKLYDISVLNLRRDVLKAEEKHASPKAIPFKTIGIRAIQVAAIFLLALLGTYWLHTTQKEASLEEVAYQSIHVPFGQRIDLDLPDGSKVWLNSGTTIQYPLSFNKGMREVILDGEAYFEIEKSEGSPFRVLAGNHTVEVLGTKFNVSVDQADNTFETALFEGSVKVFESASPHTFVEMNPNTFVHLVDGALQMQLLGYRDKYNWRDGILCFEKEPFEYIMKTFEKSYGCKIVIANKKVNKYLYTGKFLQTDGVDYALSLLRKSVYFTYSRDKETNTIVIN